jgi:predicted RNase H-like HicB family nuclease
MTLSGAPPRREDSRAGGLLVFGEDIASPMWMRIFSYASRKPDMKIKVVVHDAEEGGFWAEVPAIPGCATEGETMEELLRNLHEAIEGCLSADVAEVAKPQDAPQPHPCLTSPAFQATTRTLGWTETLARTSA